jgi:hypothetical protein
MKALCEAGQLVPFSAVLTYDPADPYAVTAVLESDAGPVAWLLSRDLLCEALDFRTGVGDVHAWPTVTPSGEEITVIELHSPDGHATLQVASDDLMAFLEEASHRVPFGKESTFLDVDGLISALLAGSAPSRRTRWIH